MSDSHLSSQLSPRIRKTLNEAHMRVKTWMSAERMWKDLLSETERQHMGGNPEACYRRLGTLGIWMELHGVSWPRAVVDVAWGIGFLDEPTSADVSGTCVTMNMVSAISPASAPSVAWPAKWPPRSTLSLKSARLPRSGLNQI